MKSWGWCLVVGLLAVGPACADDPPKDTTADVKKDATPKEQYDALVKDHAKQQSDAMAEIRSTKGEEQQKHVQKYMNLGRDFAEKFFKLAEANAKDPVATDALFWIMQNGTGSTVFKEASDKVLAIVADMPAADLVAKLRSMRNANANVIGAVVKRAETEGTSEQAADLLAWAATTGSFVPAGQKAMALIIEKFPDHKSVEQMCAIMGRRYSAKSVETLKQIFEKSEKPNIKSAAALGLARCLVSQTDTLGDEPATAEKVAAEAEKYFNVVINDFGKDFAAKGKEAEQELKVFQTLRVGKVAPDITGPDLDGKEFKLSDYRGKVVMLDFWGHW